MQLLFLMQMDVSARGSYDNYLNGLMPLFEKVLLTLPVIPKECKSNSHMFYIILKNEETTLMDYLKSKETYKDYE